MFYSFLPLFWNAACIKRSIKCLTDQASLPPRATIRSAFLRRSMLPSSSWTRDQQARIQSENLPLLSPKNNDKGRYQRYINIVSIYHGNLWRTVGCQLAEKGSELADIGKTLPAFLQRNKQLDARSNLYMRHILRYDSAQSDLGRQTRKDNQL